MQKLDNYEDEIYTLKANIDIEKEKKIHSFQLLLKYL